MGKKIKVAFILITVILIGWRVSFTQEIVNKKLKANIFQENSLDLWDNYGIKVVPKKSNGINDKEFHKKVFLTFDDGPSRNNTPKILEILKENDVKATFFVIGTNAERNKDILKSLDDSKMCVLPHSYSHEKNIYKSSELYFEDLKKCEITVEKILGRGIRNIVRMPGGSGTGSGKRTVIEQIKNGLKNQEMMYVDWNVSSADASAPTVDRSLIINGVKNHCKNVNFVVMLMHDSATKTTTVEALPEIIQYLKASGYEFRDFNELTYAERNELIKRKIAYR
ncbi:polysaccharide deacetylase [Clostridium sp. 19966]|uniref:polysaccharide deacetylase family protein n=1 Tax=Clostridium sp. 19966 TaxID=2768166 RepID=UPI0028DFCA29|nr:polysaccharide deacetylase family protein [Clostridium sp. 19966]MDT8719095.1 polysaccharide deacetylase [Clostridium sp. 19966]